MPKDAKLRIGVVHRVEDDKCTRKSQVGDKLAMHCTLAFPPARARRSFSFSFAEPERCATCCADTGWTRANGKVFDSSVSRGSPFEFT